ncbi:hypothetical protein EVAR_32658_1 [Eumeta japonica]|uniref:Uncharacterized protein n=1 Tax=Eumeta variegata TaxID=151549 RepID=A0A4C1WSS2_EUMVA|nr:hypothetical protein EVAR_32658_1 [Eumeta japonica]
MVIYWNIIARSTAPLQLRGQYAAMRPNPWTHGANSCDSSFISSKLKYACPLPHTQQKKKRYASATSSCEAKRHFQTILAVGYETACESGLLRHSAAVSRGPERARPPAAWRRADRDNKQREPGEVTIVREKRLPIDNVLKEVCRLRRRRRSQESLSLATEQAVSGMCAGMARSEVEGLCPECTRREPRRELAEGVRGGAARRGGSARAPDGGTSLTCALPAPGRTARRRPPAGRP